MKKIVPVVVASESAPTDLPAGNGRIEIVLATGERIIVGADVHTAALARVIKVLSRR